MRAVISLEYIGENYAVYNRVKQAHMAGMHIPEGIRDMLDMGVSRPWVARLTGLDARFGFARTFQRGQKDYSEANSVGSRGVYLHFPLEMGLYEVFALVTWTRSRRYFIRVDADAAITEISKEEVIRCLQSPQPAPTNAG